MSEAITFLTMMLAAVFTENIVFSRAAGTSWALYLIKNPKELWGCTLILSLITLFSGAAGYPLRSFLSGMEYTNILIPMGYIAVMAVFYLITSLVLKYLLPAVYEKLENKLGAAVFNCAVLGGLLIPSVGRLDFISTLGYGLGSSLGFAFSVIVIGYGIDKLRFKNVPKSFRGLPITLIYLGLLSLAFYGLIGHQLSA